MPAAPQITFLREGTNPAPIAVTRAEISRSHGITPASIILDVVPTDLDDLLNGSRIGNLVIHYEDQRLVIRQCIIDATSFHADTRSRVTSFIIFDWRWKWQFGFITGHYNRRLPSGEIIHTDDVNLHFTEVWSKRTLHELVRQCLFWILHDPIIGELFDYDIAAAVDSVDLSALPYGVFPEVQWEHENPARALADLCDLVGCRVALGWDDMPKIVRIGEGQPLPEDLPLIRAATSIDVQERPDGIAIVTAPIIYQIDFELFAVGEDLDGQIRSLKNLSYAPDKTADDGGFSNQFSLSTGIWFDTNDEDLLAFANKSVFRWYRVKGPFIFPSDEDETTRDREIKVERASQIVPILPFRATTVEENGRIKQQDPILYGVWYNDETDQNSRSTLVPLPDDIANAAQHYIDMIIPGGYTIDADEALVMLSQPLIALDDNDNYTLPSLRLRASFNFRQQQGDWRVGVRVRDFYADTLGTNRLYIHRPELTIAKIAEYSGSRFTPFRVKTNFDAVREIADSYLYAAEEAYNLQNPAEAVYAGFFPQIELDGAIRTIAFTLDSSGSRPITTTVYRDQDLPAYGQLSYTELRQQEKISKLLRKETTKNARIEAQRIRRER